MKIALLGSIPKGDEIREGWTDWKNLYIETIRNTIPLAEFFMQIHSHRIHGLIQNLVSHSKSSFLHERLKVLVEKEREITLHVLHALFEADRAKLFAERGFSSLHEYCVQDLGYSDGAAYRRIHSMRLLHSLPEETKARTEEALESGKLTLTTLSTHQGFFRQEKREGNEVSIFEKETLLSRIEGKSKRETEEEITRLKPGRIRKDQERVVSETVTEVRFTADNTLLEKLDRVRALLSHKHPHATYQDLMTEMAEFWLKKMDPLQKPEQLSSRTTKPAFTETASPEKLKHSTQGNPRFIGARIKREIWKKHKGKCSYEDPATRHRCSGRRFLEIDHIRPVAKGGTSEPGNLRLYCRAHNQLAAEKEGVHLRKRIGKEREASQSQSHSRM